jgi:hypothetical protein
MPVRVPVLLAALAAILAAAPAASARQWLAGDGHVHTCYSHDAYCPPGDDSGPQELYSSFGTVDQRFREASVKGLHFLVVSDHDDRRAWSDPAFGSHGVVGVRAYEWSLSGGRGHAQMLGAARDYGEASDPAAAAAALRADGGLFQANHPSYRAGEMVTTCEQAASATTPLHWRLGFSVQPDTIEVWNATTLIPPSELFWECWLQRGVRMPVTAGSDSHGATQPSLGLPTTWVLADERGEPAILDAIRRGRTTLSRLPPALGGSRLLLEADADGDGVYESTMGDTVEGGTPMRVRAEGLSSPALVRVRAGGRTIVEDQPLVASGEVRFKAPAAPSWVRAVAYQQQWTTVVDPFCAPPPHPDMPSSPLDLCTSDLAITGMTSPMYVGSTVDAAADGSVPPPAGAGTDEPDDEAPLAPAEQSRSGAPLPVVPSQRALPRIRLTVCGRRASWSPPGLRYDVAVRRSGRWLRVARATPRTSVRLGRGVRAVRVRAVDADGRSGPWAAARAGHRRTA